MPSYHLVIFSSFHLTTKSILELVYSKVNFDILILSIYNWMLPAASNLIELVGHITDGASATNTSKSVAKINSAEGRVNIQNQRRPNIGPRYLASIWIETNIARYLANFWIGGWQHRNGIEAAGFFGQHTSSFHINWDYFHPNASASMYQVMQFKLKPKMECKAMSKRRGSAPTCLVSTEICSVMFVLLKPTLENPFQGSRTFSQVFQNTPTQLQCKWLNLVGKFVTNANGAIWLPNLQLMQVSTLGLLYLLQCFFYEFHNSL